MIDQERPLGGSDGEYGWPVYISFIVFVAGRRRENEQGNVY